MSPEPLKGKRIEIIGELFDIEKDSNGNFVFFGDVKSAVKGLLNELEQFRVGIFPDIYSEEYSYSVEYDADGEYIRYEWVVELIKKWLADAVVEDELD